MACSSADNAKSSPGSTAAAGDTNFTALARTIIDDHLQRYPSAASDLGVHKWDDRIEDYSQAGVQAETQALAGFRAKLAAVDTTPLSVDQRADRELLIRTMDAAHPRRRLDREAGPRSPDAYSSLASRTRRTSS